MVELMHDAEITCECQYTPCERECGDDVRCKGFWGPWSLCDAACGAPSAAALPQ